MDLYSNWRKPTLKEIKSEWLRKRENKTRIEMFRSKGVNFFDSVDLMKKGLRKGNLVDLDSEIQIKLKHCILTESFSNLEATGADEEDIQQLKNKFTKFQKVGAPIVIKTNGCYYMVSGNTTFNVYYLCNIRPKHPKILLIDYD